MIALLVGGTLASQASKSGENVETPNGGRDDGTCWRLAWRWWCLSWGTGSVPVTTSIDKVFNAAFACDTVRCYVRQGVDVGFDMLGLFFENPIKLWTLGMKYLSASVIAKLPKLWKIVGLYITFLFLNIMALIYLQVDDVIMKLWKVYKWICRLPLISLIVSFFKYMYTFFVSIPGKVEKEEKKEKERKEKQANAILGPSSRLLKEISEVLAEAEKALETREEVKKEERKEDSVPCPRCGNKGHDESMCQYQYESYRTWRTKPKTQWKPKQEKKEAASEQKASSSTEAGPSKGMVAMVCVEDQTALHSPIWINGVKFTRCLIDSGSEVNVISVKDAVKNGFVYELGGIKKISGFNGSSSPVDSLMDCDIRLGQSGETKKVEFLDNS